VLSMSLLFRNTRLSSLGRSRIEHTHTPEESGILSTKKKTSKIDGSILHLFENTFKRKRISTNPNPNFIPTLKHKNFLGQTNWRHFSRKCADTKADKSMPSTVAAPMAGQPLKEPEHWVAPSPRINHIIFQTTVLTFGESCLVFIKIS